MQADNVERVAAPSNPAEPDEADDSGHRDQQSQFEGEMDALSSLLEQETQEASAGAVVDAISSVARDAGEFYVAVQQWKAIPRAFERLEWSASELTSKTVLGWVIAELSRTVFAHEELDMELADYILGLIQHPDFRQPDLLVAELHEFLGDAARAFVLSLWKFLVVEIAMKTVFHMSKAEMAENARQHQTKQARTRELTALERERQETAKLGRTQTTDVKDSRKTVELRDYKRRRPKYRTKRGLTPHEALREFLAKQMLDLSEETGRELVECKPETTAQEQASGLAPDHVLRAQNWTQFTDPLAVRDMHRPRVQEEDDRDLLHATRSATSQTNGDITATVMSIFIEDASPDPDPDPGLDPGPDLDLNVDPVAVKVIVLAVVDPDRDLIIVVANWLEQANYGVGHILCRPAHGRSFDRRRTMKRINT
ncbi:TPA: hypothetical protein N0F65_001085 [Lagenidium giganteum]|uniref:PWI domain-containing protein n=1 Tax=Lagenidium giganteum TaxID=4803 RepID=A0AAV2YFN3_9STRA|nr:TPA: hypothetical protein N0F65_001085 [Lagenidium giganteum]